MEIDKIIQDYRNIGIQLKRSAESFSFGDVDECKRLFIEAFSAVDASVSRFQWLKEYDDIIQWMSSTDGKGLLLSGSVGLGKTVIVTGVIPLIFKYKFNRFIHPFSAYDMEKYESEICKYHFVCVDDVGCEPIANRFGVKEEIFCRVVEAAEREMKPLFVTTNLTGEEFVRRYGDRVADRISRLCRMIKLQGKSMR